MSVPKYYNGTTAPQKYFYTPFFKSEPEGSVVLYPNGTSSENPAASPNCSTDIADGDSVKIPADQNRHTTNSKPRRKLVFMFIFTLIVLSILAVLIALFTINFLIPNYFSKNNGKHSSVQYWKNQPELSESVRLPQFVFPSNYNLNFTFDLQGDQTIIRGSAIINVNAETPTNYVLLHSEVKSIDFSLTKFVLENGETLPVKDQKIDRKTNFYLIVFQDFIPVSENNYLELYFISPIIQHPANWGVYLTDYEIRGGISTQFQPGWARMLFPCFDEPFFKSTFRVSVTHDSDFMALSNMPESRSYSRGEVSLNGTLLVTTEFEPTPLMSTYLIALYIVPKNTSEPEFTFIFNSQIQPNHSVLIRGFFDYRTNYIDENFKEVFVMVINETLKWCEQVFDAPYMLPKLDFVWVYHLALGMENWGLITIKYDINVHTTVMTLIHEVLHQWLGNVASIEWWSDIWITEALVTYLEHKIYQDLPGLDDNSMVELLTLGFRTRNWPEALNPHITAPDSHTLLTQTFVNMATYQKGAWLYWGVEQLTDFDTVKSCAQKFYHQFSTVCANMPQFLNLLSDCTEFEMESKISDPLGDVLTSWLEKGGMPIVTVSKTDSGEITVSQTPSCKALDEAWICPAKNSIWKIPLFITDVSGNFLSWEYLKSREQTFPGYQNVEELFFNYNLTFPFSVQYSNDLWDKLWDAFKEKKIDTFQACLITGDLKNNIDVGTADIYPALRMFQKFNTEDYEHYQMMNPFQFLYFLQSTIRLPDKYEEPFLNFFIETGKLIKFDEFCGLPESFGGHEGNKYSCMMYLKNLCRHNISRCRELLSNRQNKPENSNSFMFPKSVSYESVLRTLVDDYDRNTKQRADFIAENIKVDTELMTLIVDEASLELIWDKLIAILFDEVQNDGYVKTDLFIRDVLQTNPDLNEVITGKFMTNLTQKVVGKFWVKNRTDSELGSIKIYEVMSIYATLMLQSSQESIEIANRVKKDILEKSKLLKSELVPMTLRLNTFDIHSRNQKMLIEFLDKRFNNG